MTCPLGTSPNRDCLLLRSSKVTDEYLSGWQIDDFVFEPCGYVLNAIQGDRYCTIHLTLNMVIPMFPETNANLY